jgi:hypothetical protein
MSRKTDLTRLVPLLLLVLALAACSQVVNTPLTGIPDPEVLSTEDLEALVESGLATRWKAEVQYFTEEGEKLSLSEVEGIIQPQYSTHADCYGWVRVAAYPGSWNAYARVYLRCPGYSFKTTRSDSWISAVSPPDSNGIRHTAYKKHNEISFDFVTVLSNNMPNLRGTYYISGMIGGRAERYTNGLLAVINPEYRANNKPYSF